MRSKTSTSPSGHHVIPHDALVVVCDSESCLFLKNAGTAQEPKFQKLDSIERDNPRAGEQSTDRPGRFNDGSGVQRSAVQETDRHELEKERFARHLAELLEEVAKRNAYEALVLVAAPQVLGEVRAHLSGDVRNKLVLEIDKDLTGHPVEAIQRIVLAA